MAENVPYESITYLHVDPNVNISGKLLFIIIIFEYLFFRNIKPSQYEFPNKLKINNLPKDKFIYSSSNEYNQDLVSKICYYHHISGTSYIVHKNIINKFVDIYKLFLDKLVDKNNIWTDQVILTHIFHDNPTIFFKLCDGYGSVTEYLF